MNLKDAYLQVPLDEKYKNMATMNTPFEMNTSQALLQDVMNFITTDFRKNNFQK